MTREDIVRLWDEANNWGIPIQSGLAEELERFAALVAAAALAEDAMQRLTDEQQMIERGTKAWADVPDATAWVQEMRGNVLAPTCRESRQVEPVAYVTGYSKGYATVQPVDRSLLMPVGMALYRSPPTISKTETVEPVAWNKYPIDTDTTREEIFRRALDGISDYERGFIDGMQEQMRRSVDKAVNALAKRKPLTDEEITRLWVEAEPGPEAFARAIERAHGIGGEG